MIKDLKLTGERLIQIPFFENLSVNEAEALLQIVTIKIYRENEPVFREGTSGDSLFVILDGTVDAVKMVGDKNFKQLARFQRYTVFGEMPLVFEGDSLRTASAIARERTRMLVLHKDDFQKLIDFGSIVAYKVAYSISRLLAARLARTDKELVHMMSQSDSGTQQLLQEIERQRAQDVTMSSRVKIQADEVEE